MFVLLRICGASSFIRLDNCHECYVWWDSIVFVQLDERQFFLKRGSMVFRCNGRALHPPTTGQKQYLIIAALVFVFDHFSHPKGVGQRLSRLSFIRY